jgi:hypothetical protein
MGGCAGKDRMKKKGVIGRLSGWRTEVRSARLLSDFLTQCLSKKYGI